MAEKNKGGRPPALVPDEKTLKTVQGLGQIQATTKECAAVLGVTEMTYIQFKKRHAPLIDDTYAEGSGKGLASLRRRQFQMSEKSATMAIWLGKQYLGQSDKQEIASTVEVIDRMTEDQIIERIRYLDAAIQPLLAVEGKGGTDAGTGSPTTH